MSTAQVDQLLAQLKREGEPSGYYLNPDEAFVRELLEGLVVNAARFGYLACPCRLATGEKAEDLDIICPCDYRDQDVSEYGVCYCGLYVSDEVRRGERPIKPIPERRQPPGMRASGTASALPSSLPYPVWRCKVCGYLCARAKAPSTCPICKASAERFERFL